MTAESARERLSRLDIRLPEPPVPRGNYRPVVVHDGVAYVSGQVSRDETGVVKGPVTSTTAAEEIAVAARLATLRAVSALNSAAGDLDAIERLVFVRGFIFSDQSFTQHSLALDVVSSLLIDIFGERGEHGRSAIGVSSLPDGGLIELEITAALRKPPS